MSASASALLLSLVLVSPAALAKGVETVRRGEAFTYSLSLGPVPGGRARMALAPPQRRGDRRLGSVTAEVEATGLAKVVSQQHNIYHLIYDADALLPRRFAFEERGLLVRIVTGDIDGRSADVRVQHAKGEQRSQGVLPQEPRDPATAYLAVRGARLRDGDRLNLVVLDGTTFYQGVVTVLLHEKIQVPLAAEAQPAIRLRCVGEPMDIHGAPLKRPPRLGTLWLSDDALRLPLRFDGETSFGLARFELTGHEGRPPSKAEIAQLPGLAQQGAAR